MSSTFGLFHNIHINVLQMTGVVRAGESKAVGRWRYLNQIDLYIFRILLLKTIQIKADEHFWLFIFVLSCACPQKRSWWDQYDDRQWALKRFIGKNGVSCRIRSKSLWLQACYRILFPVPIVLRAWQIQREKGESRCLVWAMMSRWTVEELKLDRKVIIRATIYVMQEELLNLIA